MDIRIFNENLGLLIISLYTHPVGPLCKYSICVKNIFRATVLATGVQAPQFGKLALLEYYYHSLWAQQHSARSHGADVGVFTVLLTVLHLIS